MATGESKHFLSSFPQLIASLTGTMYEVVYVPEENWLKITRRIYSTKWFEARKLRMIQHENSSQPSEAMELLTRMMEEISEDPLVVEAEKLFGKEFVEVHDD